MVREMASTLVYFEDSSATPMLVNSRFGTLKIVKVYKYYRERRNLKDCIIYLCQAEGRDDPVELRWDLALNKWFIEKL